MQESGHEEVQRPVHHDDHRHALHPKPACKVRGTQWLSHHAIKGARDRVGSEKLDRAQVAELP